MILIPRSMKKAMVIRKSMSPLLSTGTIDNGVISLMYVDEVKGIEADRVFVFDEDMTENEKYVSYTRALSELVIVMTKKNKLHYCSQKQ